MIKRPKALLRIKTTLRHYSNFLLRYEIVLGVLGMVIIVCVEMSGQKRNKYQTDTYMIIMRWNLVDPNFHLANYSCNDGAKLQVCELKVLSAFYITVGNIELQTCSPIHLCLPAPKG